MKPGQKNLNEFELAILHNIAKDEPALLPIITVLNVLSREFTGVGSFTNFSCETTVPELGNNKIGSPTIVMPNIRSGLGAVLFCESGKPSFLEVYTYGSDEWDGNYEGFSIRDPS